MRREGSKVKIVTAEEMYTIDRYTMEKMGLTGPMLMENAGQSLVFHMLPYFEKNERIAVMIGAGNNGGDGFVVSRQLQSLGYSVDTWVISSLEKMKGDALFHYKVYERSGYSVYSLERDGFDLFTRLMPSYTLLIDALLGIGVKGELLTPYKEVIEIMNQSNARIFSVDIPSGILADEKEDNGAIQARMTFTLHCYKQSAFLYPARNHYGEVIVCPIGIPKKAEETVSRSCSIWTNQKVRLTLPRRKEDSFKGTYGKLLVIGGSKGMPGAVMMTAKSALRSGAGLTTMLIPSSIRKVVSSNITEAMFIEAEDEQGYFASELSVDFSHFDTIAIGPGMGRAKGCEKVVAQVLETNRPLLIDADALYFVAKLKDRLLKRTAPTIVTPHTGEMARLTGYDVAYIEKNRFDVAQEFAMNYQTYVVLKGPFTIVSTPTGEQFVNPTGNPALAKGGSGDVLTGIIAGLLKQHSNVQQAISNACFIHGAVADHLVATSHSPLDVVASDLIQHLPAVLSDLYASSF